MIQHQHNQSLVISNMKKNTGVAIGNFQAPVAKDIGALLLRQPADRLAVGEALHNKK